MTPDADVADLEPIDLRTVREDELVEVAALLAKVSPRWAPIVSPIAIPCQTCREYFLPDPERPRKHCTDCNAPKSNADGCYNDGGY